MSDHPERLRLFVAVGVPEDRLRALAEAVSDLQARVRGARWAPIENQHVTLKFLGSTPAQQVGAVEEVVARASSARPAAEVALTKLGVFPSIRRARVLWAGIDDPAGTLAAVASELEKGFEALGYRAEKRSFTAHLTLARFKSPPRLGELPEPPEQARVPFEVDRLRLYRSRLHPSGARYEVVREFPLGA